MHTSPYIDVDRIDNMVIITRGSIIPGISRLTMEQAVALMVLGQAMESSAGDPTQAGKIKGEFFYDPFVAGDRAEHANILYEILKGLPHMNYYLINTGGVGEGYHYADQTVKIVREFADHDPRIRIESFAHAGLPATSRNRALKIAGPCGHTFMVNVLTELDGIDPSSSQSLALRLALNNEKNATALALYTCMKRKDLDPYQDLDSNMKELLSSLVQSKMMITCAIHTTIQAFTTPNEDGAAALPLEMAALIYSKVNEASGQPVEEYEVAQLSQHFLKNT